MAGKPWVGVVVVDEHLGWKQMWGLEPREYDSAAIQDPWSLLMFDNPF